MKNSDLLVSIHCMTYNHAPYIRECLDGFIMQKTNFLFEAIVHDDASTDETADIIREYAEKYPEIIKPILQTENQYSKRDGAIKRTMNAHSHGKYIAICEGDDYWIDPLKLQKQVDFLESNSDYSMCFTNAEVKCEGSVSKSYEILFNHLKTMEYSGEDILSKWSVPTASVLFRFYNENVIVDKRFISGDIVLFLWLVQKGRVFCLNEKTVVYRKNDNGVSSTRVHYTKLVNHYLALNEIFNNKYDVIIQKHILKAYVEAFIYDKQSKLQILKTVIKDTKSLMRFIYYLPRKIIRDILYRIMY